MKNQLTFKLWAALFVIAASVSTAFGQYKPGDVGGLGTSDGENAIFTHSNTTFKLTANPTSSDGTNTVTLTLFDWHIKEASGAYLGITAGTSGVPGTFTINTTNNNELDVSGLAPGYYVFGASGAVNATSCYSDIQDFVVFVMAPLEVELKLTNAAAILEYCTEDAASTVDIDFTATPKYKSTVPFNTVHPLTDPAVTAFELEYKWYKASSSATFDPTASTPIATTNTASLDVSSLANFQDVGEWKYYVTVQYTLKDYKGFDFATAMVNTTTEVIVKVTPKPTKPTITITSE